MNKVCRNVWCQQRQVDVSLISWESSKLETQIHMCQKYSLVSGRAWYTNTFSSLPIPESQQNKKLKTFFLYVVKVYKTKQKSPTHMNVTTEERPKTNKYWAVSTVKYYDRLKNLPPQTIHILVSRTCEYYLIWQKEKKKRTADVIKWGS